MNRSSLKSKEICPFLAIGYKVNQKNNDYNDSAKVLFQSISCYALTIFSTQKFVLQLQ